MIALEIELIKEFMEQLFRGEMFDRFHVTECEVTTFATFRIDGKRQDAWYDSGEKPEDPVGYVTWRQLKTIVYAWIRGKKAPQKLTVDFCHYMENGDVGSLRIRYEKEKLHIFTGYMQKEFSLSKESQQDWDENCMNFIKKHGIVSTHLN